MKTYYVYMLRCADGSFYVGITNNIELRVGQHEFGFDPECSDFRNVDDAIAWEKQLKGWSRAKKRALVEGDWKRSHELAKRRKK